MLLRMRGPSGQATLSVDDGVLVSDFMAMVCEKLGMPAKSRLEILAGFPPKPLAQPSDASATVASLGIQAGDSLTVRQLAGSAAPAPLSSAPPPPAAAPPAAAATFEAPPAAVASQGFSVEGMSEDEQLARAIAASLGEEAPPPPPPPPVAFPPSAAAAPAVAVAGSGSGNALFEPIPGGGAVARRVVADDNSCLFSAVGYVAKGSRSAGGSLRSVVAEAVLADPFEWNEAVLGKEPEAYAVWIQDKRRWGGAIELSILSKKLGIEIAAFDIQTQRVDVYGQGEGYTERVLLVYDGLHYDALAVAERVEAGEFRDKVSIPPSGARTDAVMAAAGRLVARLHTSRAFTNTSTFTLRCGTCKQGLTGEKEALAHAQATGHTNFTEY